MKAVSTQVMRELDRGTIRNGTLGEILMERAGVGAFRELRRYLSGLPACHAERLLVFCGKGNNGGDGYVVARLAAAAGVPVEVVGTCPIAELSGDALLNAQRLPQSVRFSVFSAQDRSLNMTPGTVVVDALLGTGIADTVRSPIAECIRQINASGLPVVALDIPSGLNGDSGRICGVAVMADLTITMGLPKAGLFAGDGPAHVGRLRVVDIGLDADLAAAAPAEFAVVTGEDVAPLLGRRRPDGHKRTFGHLAVIGGSTCYAGAPMLAARAGLRGGCGMVTVFAPASICPCLDRSTEAVIVRPVDDGGQGAFQFGSCRDIGDRRSEFEAVVIGCGMTASADQVSVLGEVLGWDCPKVIDADGLRVMALDPGMLRGKRNEIVLTPHPGEMRTLVSAFCAHYMNESRPRQAVGLAAAIGGTVVLKGQGSIVACSDGNWSLNTSGRTSLATAGTGDVLAGLIGGFLAQGLAPAAAARAGTYIHGLAGEISRFGDRGLIADDLPGLIPEAMCLTSPLS